MDTGLLLILLIIVIVAVIAGNIISSFIQKKDSFSPKEIIEKIDGIKKSFKDEFDPVKTGLTENKTLIGTKAGDLERVHQKLVDTLTGSSRTGVTGELLLENFFEHSGLVKGTQYIENQNYIKDGTTLRVEFAIKHPTGLVLPIDSHWTRTLYEHLLELRNQPTSDERDSKIKEKS